ncbi:MAG: tol-pal system YbgF family protein [Sandaracinaceae bacterium]
MRTLAIVIASAAALGLLLPAALPVVACAQDPDAETNEDTTEDPARVDEALVMYERARERYEAGDFDRAVLLLEEALVLHDAPELHYNLARALQELGRWAEARDEYIAYRERAPESAVSERVDARIELLDRRIAEEEAAAAPPEPDVPPPPPEPPPAPPLDPAPWVLAGSGAVIAAAAIPFGVLFLDADSTAANAPNHEAAFGPANDATNFAIVANVLLGVGVVTGLVGIVWGIVSAADR